MHYNWNIFETITQGELSELQWLVETDSSLAMARDPNGVSALMTALYYRKADMVQLLRGLIPELDIFEAAALGDTQAMTQFLENPENIAARSSDGFTPLHLAAFFNQPAIASLLLDKGAEVNAVAGNPSRVCPLHSAVACGATEIVKMLLENGADANAGQQGGWTALQAAARHGNQGMVELLLQYGADPGQAADDGQTAITMAADDTIRQRLQDAKG